MTKLPEHWKGYQWSQDYRKLYEMLKTGVKAACIIPYYREYDPPIWDICSGKYNENGFEFGARGICYTQSYPNRDHSFEAFEQLCKTHDILFIEA